MMKDEKYFDDRLFVFSNKKLKDSIMALSKKKKQNVYVIVDEALRNYVNDNGVDFKDKPKILKLV